MNIQELIDTLTQLQEDFGNEIEVRVAEQPNYPLVANIAAISLLPAKNSTCADDCDDDECDGLCNDDNEMVVYIACDDAREYGSRKMWEDAI